MVFHNDIGKEKTNKKALASGRLNSARFRFFGSLNDFLPYQRQRRNILFGFHGHPAIKDTLEAIGVPHPEIDCIFVNARPVNFSYQLKNKDKIIVYPGLYSLKPKKAVHLKPKILKFPKFILDVHLGKLTRHLRLMGYDSLYQKDFTDGEIADIAAKKHRVVLTRDLGLLKHRKIKRGFWLRSTDPERQIREIAKEHHLTFTKRTF